MGVIQVRQAGIVAVPCQAVPTLASCNMHTGLPVAKLLRRTGDEHQVSMHELT